MKTMIIISLVALVSMPVFAQNKRTIPPEGPTVEEYLGVWQAFREGDMPAKSKGEEPSKLVIFRDSKNRIVVFLAYRYADRQIKFIYGIASLLSGALRFNDQDGFPYVLSFGENADYGRFLGVHPGDPDVENEYGAYLRLNVK